MSKIEETSDLLLSMSYEISMLDILDKSATNLFNKVCSREELSESLKMLLLNSLKSSHSMLYDKTFEYTKKNKEINAKLDSMLKTNYYKLVIDIILLISSMFSMIISPVLAIFALMISQTFTLSNMAFRDKLLATKKAVKELNNEQMTKIRNIKITLDNSAGFLGQEMKEDIINSNILIYIINHVLEEYQKCQKLPAMSILVEDSLTNMLQEQVETPESNLDELLANYYSDERELENGPSLQRIKKNSSEKKEMK